MKPKVSVCVTVYNLEQYLDQTFQSVLAQKTTFPVEIVVVDDCSTDSSRDIIRRYEKEHPGVFTLGFNEQNMKAPKSYLKAFALAQGEYLAVLDGDDFWTDPYKLQKQVDFLDANPDFVMSHTNALMFYTNGSTALFTKRPKKERYTVVELLEDSNNWNSSVVYRNIFKGNYPDWLGKLIHNDYPLHVLHALRGKIHYMAEATGNYRIHERNISHSNTGDIGKKVAFILNSEYAAEMLQQNATTAQQKYLLKLMRGRLLNHVSGLYFYNGQPGKFLQYAIKSFWFCPFRTWFEYKEAFNITFKVAKK